MPDEPNICPECLSAEHKMGCSKREGKGLQMAATMKSNLPTHPNPDEIRLAVGELTGSEMRVAQTVIRWRDWMCRTLLQGAYERMACAEARAEAAELEVERKDEALQKIADWARAYPLDVFPEPDFAKAHEQLQAGGMTLDAISASNMRHVITQVQSIAEGAIAKEGKKP
jgi:hypothetical protein